MKTIKKPISNVIDKIVETLIYIEDEMQSRGLCDNDCKDECGNKCPFNRMPCTCSLSKVIDELDSCWIDDDLLIEVKN